MLEILFGSEAFAEVLLFLFVNRKGYGTQMHRLLGLSLTPVQKALLRLEKGGIVTSYFEGKTRVYSFDPHYPLLTPLEEMLKQAYALFSAEERKKYSVVREQSYLKGAAFLKKGPILKEFWDRLTKVREVSFVGNIYGREGRGQASVSVESVGPTCLHFQERGSWTSKDGQTSAFFNVFRWTLDRAECLLTVERLPFGEANPLLLFHLFPHENGTLVSIEAPSIDGGSVFGQAFWNRDYVRLTWRAIGPQKNAEMDYVYI